MEGLLLALYLVVQGLGWLLSTLNLRHLERHGATVPPGFADAFDPDMVRRTVAYTAARSRAGVVESLTGAALLALFLFGGLLPLYDQAVALLGLSFVPAGILFFLGLHLAQTLLNIPFSLYRNFVIEKRFGFNTMPGRLWLSDLLKTAVLSSLLLMLLAGGGLWLVSLSPERWWLWAWLFFTAVSLFLHYLSPYLIEPLFFTFEPVRRAELAGRIGDLAAKAGLQVGRVLQVDASRRSRHSNAYVTGIGRVKRIVLFDTLLEQMEDDEVLAVLAHEIGHWKMGHLWKRLLAVEVLALGGCFLGYRLLEWGGLPGLLGLPQASFAAQAVILCFVASLAAFPLTPLANGLSRRGEYQADRYAAALTGAPQALAAALVGLARENLANLHPHQLFAWFYYSHPPFAERVGALRCGRGAAAPGDEGING